MGSVTAMTVAIDGEGVARGAEELLPELGERYEDLHSHPELSFQEHRAAAVQPAEETVAGPGPCATTACSSASAPPTSAPASTSRRPRRAGCCTARARPWRRATLCGSSCTGGAGTGRCPRRPPADDRGPRGRRRRAGGRHVGSLHAGTKENIIAERAELGLSVRTFDAQVRTRVLEAIARITHGEAHAAGSPQPAEITTTYSFPSLHNDAEATDAVEASFRDHFGHDRLLPAPQVSASEGFGVFGDRGGFPSTLWFVGGAEPDHYLQALAADRVRKDVPMNHSPHFAPVQEPTIAAGVEAMYVAARQWLTG